MRSALALAITVLLAAACSDAGVSPTGPGSAPPTIRPSHTSVGPDLDTTDDLCGGFSPCDAFDYRLDVPNYTYQGHPTNVDGLPCDPETADYCFRTDLGAAGFCFLPPTVDNHLSDPACSGNAVPGLDREFQLAWCQLNEETYDGSAPPSILSCQNPDDWQDLVEDTGAGFYASSVQFKRKDWDIGDMFRVYVVRDGVHFAHRDVVIDPNLTSPADFYLHSIGYGNEPFKLRITDAGGCSTYDTDVDGTDNAATCVIGSGASVPQLVGPNLFSAQIDFQDVGDPFVANFAVSECNDLEVWSSSGEPNGVPLVDTPLADCKVSVETTRTDPLPEPATIVLTLTDSRWDEGGVFENARLNVLQYDDLGVGVLPLDPAPAWLDEASPNGAFGLIGRGLRKLASFFGVEPLHAGPSAGALWQRLSDFQVSLQPVMDFDFANTDGAPGEDCAGGAPTPEQTNCLDLGTFDGTSPVSVSVKVSAPDATGPWDYSTGGGYLDVPGTRLHFFPSTGTVACPLSAQCYSPDAATGETTDESTTPWTIWTHGGTIVITDGDGLGTVDWTLVGGSNELNVVACNVARPGTNEPNPPDEPGNDGVWGTLGGRLTNCSARSVTAVGFDNGPADGFTPYEPVSNVFGSPPQSREVGSYGLPLTFRAETCPQISVDGTEGPGEWECAHVDGFTAPLKGKKTTDPNAWIYTYNDSEYLYVGLKVKSTDLNAMFLTFDNDGDGFEAAGDDILLLRLKGEPAGGTPFDWHLTQPCIDNNASTLCGLEDPVTDVSADALPEPLGAADINTAAADDPHLEDGTGYVFYEWRRLLNVEAVPGNTDHCDYDLCVASRPDRRGAIIQVTSGSGGGKGGFVYPDDGTYYEFDVK